MGSASVLFYNSDVRVGGMAISVYKDTTGHDPSFGDHHNLYLQWETPDFTNHTNTIPNRHIKLSDKLTIESLFDGKTQKKIEKI